MVDLLEECMMSAVVRVTAATGCDRPRTRAFAHCQLQLNYWKIVYDSSWSRREHTWTRAFFRSSVMLHCLRTIMTCSHSKGFIDILDNSCIASDERCAYVHPLTTGSFTGVGVKPVSVEVPIGVSYMVLQHRELGVYMLSMCLSHSKNTHTHWKQRELQLSSMGRKKREHITLSPRCSRTSHVPAEQCFLAIEKHPSLLTHRIIPGEIGNLK